MKFLRHVERTRVLIHLIDAAEASGRDPLHDLQVINAELGAFSAELGAKPQLVVVNKIDAVQDMDHLRALQAHCAASDTPLHRISAVSGEGVRDLLEATWALVEKLGDETAPTQAEDSTVERRI